MDRFQGFSLVIVVFLASVSFMCAAETRKEKLERLEQEENSAFAREDFPEAARACAEALKLSPTSEGVQACATALKGKVPNIAKAGSALLGAGDFKTAYRFCYSALIIDFENPEAAKCANGAEDKIVKQAADRVRLQQARAALAAGDVANATAMLKALAASENPGTLAETLKLGADLDFVTQVQNDQKGKADIDYAETQVADGKWGDGATTLKGVIASNASPSVRNRAEALMKQSATSLNRITQAQSDQKGKGAIEYAKTLIADGKRDAAATALKDVIVSNASESVRNSAEALMKQSATSWPTVFRESVRAPWIMQFLAALLTVAGLWIILHWLRDAWRWGDTNIVGKFRKSVPWTFSAVAGDDSLGAQDPVLDAIRRVPSEVRKPIWTPTRLLLYPGALHWEVWEDFGVTTKCAQLHEKVFDPSLTAGDGDKALAEAFQSLQFTAGPIGIGNIAKFWTGLVDWWHTGQPSFSGWAHQNTISDGKAEIVIRLTCSGGAYGTVSALASTLGEPGIDAVSLSAERAAYKLLHRIAEHDETAEQIDAHAAFRQGATTIASCVRSVVDVQTDKDANDARLNKAVYNAEFARQIFNRDSRHRDYYVAALRFEAIAYALLGREAAALMRLEELEDIVTPPQDPCAEQIRLEALYNQAILHVKRGLGLSAPAEAHMARQLLADLAQTQDAELANAAHVWQLAQLSSTSRGEWPSLSQPESDAVLKGASALIQGLDKAATAASGRGRRQYVLLANQARRHYAVAQLRFIAAFTLPGRGPFAAGATPIGTPIAALVQTSIDCFAKSEVVGPDTQSALVTRAYGLLLQSKWQDAEQLAKQALAADPTDQFAVYVAAEASHQRKDDVAARKYLSNLQVALFTDPALSELASALAPAPSS